MRRFLGLALILALFCQPMSLLAMPQEQILEDFETFWKSYKEAYVFFELKKEKYGVDWDELHAAYRPRAEKCSSKAELIRIVTEMQCRLRDGHCGNMGLSTLMAESPVLLQPMGFVPVADGEIAVAGVRPGTPPAEAGIERGDVLLVFAGKPVATLAREARNVFAASSEGQFWSNFSKMLMVWNPLLGQAPASCAVKVRKPDGTVVEADLPWMTYAPQPAEEGDEAVAESERERADDEASQGELPITVKIFDEANVAYMKIDSWMKTQHPGEQLDRLFTQIADTKGLVLDLRGNGGGVGPWGVLFCTYLVGENDASGKKPNDAWMDRRLSEVFFRTVLSQAGDDVFEQIFTQPEAMQYVLSRLGVEMELDEVKSHFVDGRYRPFEVRLLLNGDGAKVPVYDKPVIALTDGGCYSTTDICLKILQDFGRITIVGSPNGAGSGSPIPFVLPNSKVQVMVPHARAYPPMGDMIEGNPCTVDLPVEMSVQDLVNGTDPVFTAGLRRLLQAIRSRSASRLAGLSVSPDELSGRRLTRQQRQRRVIGEPQLVPDWMRDARIRNRGRIDGDEIRGLKGR